MQTQLLNESKRGEKHQWCWLAVVSLTMAIISVCLFFATMVLYKSVPDIVGVILHVFAWGFLLHSVAFGLVAVNRSPELKGRGVAIASLLLDMAMFIFLIFGVIYWGYLGSG